MNSVFREFSSKGRLSRSGYAIRILLVILLVIVGVLFIFLGLTRMDIDEKTGEVIAISLIVGLMLFCNFYGTAIGTRRCHDIGNAGDALYSMSTAFKRGVVGPNEYGPDPLGDSNQQKPS